MIVWDVSLVVAVFFPSSLPGMAPFAGYVRLDGV